MTTPRKPRKSRAKRAKTPIPTVIPANSEAGKRQTYQCECCALVVPGVDYDHEHQLCRKCSVPLRRAMEKLDAAQAGEGVACSDAEMRALGLTQKSWWTRLVEWLNRG